MSILKYFAKKKDSCNNFRLPDVIVSVSTTLSPKDIRSANESVKPLVKQLEVNKPARKVSKREKYNGYSPAAEGIVASRDQGLLAQHGGHIQITNTWARPLLT